MGRLLSRFRKAAAVEKPLEILGVEGAKISSGFVHDEFLTKLQGERGRRVFREMRDNDAVASAILFAVEMLLRSVEWTVSSDIDDPEGVDFLYSIKDDMSHTWSDFIGNVLTMLTYGWQYTEVVYKRRVGPMESDPRRRSKYTDGKIGIRKLADRSQETLNRWEIDEKDGSVLGMWQDRPNGGGGTIFIPINRALLFRPHMHKGSPEGRSVLRGAYRSWFFVKNIQEIEAIAIERELNGLPVVYIPNEILNGTSDEAKAAVATYTKMVRDIKFNEQGGVVLPSDPFYDMEGKPINIRQVELTLLNAKGSRAIDTDKVVKRYQGDIARTILADFIMLGQGDRGSFALSRSKIDLFATALEGWLGAVAETCNRHLIPNLWRLNGLPLENLPYYVPGKVAPEDIKELGDYIESLSRSGIVVTDTETENHLRDVAGLPEAQPLEDEEMNTIPAEDNPVVPENPEDSGALEE